MNHYYLHTRFGMTIGTKRKLYRKKVIALCTAQVDLEEHFAADKILFVRVNAFPPDHRKRDLDNLNKGLLDALTHAGVYADDSQIHWLGRRRRTGQPGHGRVIVVIVEIDDENPEPAAKPVRRRTKKTS